MSGGNEAEDIVSEPAAIEGSNNVEEQDTDKEDDAADQADDDN